MKTSIRLQLGESATIIFPPLVDQIAWLKVSFEPRTPDALIGIPSLPRDLNLQLFNCSLLSEVTLTAFKKIIDEKIQTMKPSIHLAIYISFADILFPLGPPPFLYLQHLKSQNPRISFVFFIHQNILTERLRARFLSVPMLFENIHYVPLNKNQLPFKNREQAKNFFLLLNDNQRRILRMLVRGVEKIPAHIMPDQEYLEKLNIIRKHYRRWKLASPLLERAALEITAGLNESLHLKNGQILIGEQDITKQFSSQQAKIMLILLKAKGKTVSREKIARTLWGSAWEEKYSDWAIDQTISKLRKKFARLWMNPRVMTIKKNQGIKIKYTLLVGENLLQEIFH